MDGTIAITRDIDLDLEPADVWSVIADGDRWREWMVDDGDIDVEPSATGWVTDDGELREVRIGDVEPGERVTFEWWPAGQSERSSSVELRILPRTSGTELHVVEAFPATLRALASAAAASWHARARVFGTHRVRVLAAAA